MVDQTCDCASCVASVIPLFWMEFIKNLPILNTPRIDYSPTFRRVCISRWICLSRIRLVALECMPYNPNTIIPLTFFLCWPIASSCLAEAHPFEHGLVFGSSHKTTWPLAIVLSRTPNRLFPYFQRPSYIFGQDYSKMSSFMSSHFPRVPF